MLGRLSVKRYDVKSKSWIIDQNGFNAFIRLDEDLFPPKKQPPTMKEKMKKLVHVDKKEIVGWQDIGEGMTLKPYDYQKKIIKFILDSHDEDDSHDTLIAAGCGAGKTPMIIGAFLECHKHHLIEGPGLIIVKASLKVQWYHEVKKFSLLKPKIIHTWKDCVSSEEGMIKRREDKLKKAEGKEKTQLEKEIKDLKSIAKRKFAAQFADADLFILNYETLNDEKVQKVLLKINPQFVASDESHYIKSDSTKRAKSLCKFNKAKVKIGATATPVQRDPRDIYGIFRFIHPQLFPKKTNFNALYVRLGYGFRVIGAKNEKQLNEKISPYMYILPEEEVASQLPDIVVSQMYCQLTNKQQEVNDTFMGELDELHEKEKSLSKGLTEEQLKADGEVQAVQAAITSRQTFLQELTLSEELFEDSDSDLAKKFITGSGSPKLDMLKDIISERVDAGKKTLIFCRYARMQRVIDEALHSVPELKDIEIAHVRGDMSPEVRYQEIYEKAKNHDNCMVLVMSDAGAEGVNAGFIDTMIEMEPAVSYAISTQRQGRIKRADSLFKTAHVIQLICENSWDEIALKIVQKKEKYDASIIKGIEA